MVDVQKRYEELVRLVREEVLLESIASTLEWDEETHMPRAGADNRARQQALLAGLKHERAIDPRRGDLLAHPALTDPLIVAGDLNVPRSSPVLRDFRDATGLADVLDGDPATTFRPTPKVSLEPIDQILATPPLRATTTLVFQDEIRLADGRSCYLSDHYGIAAAFST